ncbi:hypothetical protein ACWDBO_31290 [Streptomyces mirabilis]|uniref:hypothetical protein n=1 Tax=Streptomyces mirabilis TaxID=68239 RepID=UPI003330B6E7
MSDRPAHLDDLLEFVSGSLATGDPLPPHNSIALDVLTDTLVENETPSPASAFTAAKYVLAQHAREMADLLIAQRAPEGVDPRHWAAAQLREYATKLDGQAVQR